ncbi:hypothetical protein HDU78_004230 [Chytriomyces hyalinus]|nr:hypothetical protein HDU78_004230 [Chytriomyces hyalinus]KAJ3264636.1 hypothetical protein HDU77_007994 [Chytriomyces hyalinus]
MPHMSHATDSTTSNNDRPHRLVAIAVDDLTISDHVADWAVRNYIHRNDTVLLLNAYSTYYTRGAAFDTSFQEASERHSQNVLRHFAKAFSFDALGFHVPVKMVSLPGEPRSVLTDAVDEMGANVLIMGSREMGTVSKAVLGSVSEYCVRHCECPVIVVRPPVQ